jgi:uncharacterized protein YegJ (DUF2314 family)
MKYYHYLGIAALFALGWTAFQGNSQSSNDSNSSKDKIIMAKDNDPDLAKATAKAQETLPEFLSVLGTGINSAFKYAVKVADPKIDVEHMWFDHVQYRNGKLEGRLANQPEWADMKYGDPIILNTNQIEDWNYVKGGEMYGGYSIRVFRDRMTLKERVDFDKELGVRLH